MSQALRHYVSHLPNWFYFLCASGGLWLSWRSGALWDYAYLGGVLLLMIPFIEYFIHKYILHLPLPENAEKHPIYHFVVKRMHYLHHEDPRQIPHIFAEWWFTIPPFLLLGGLLYLISGNADLTLVFMSLLMAYFLVYEWTHFVAHFDAYTPKTRYGRYLKKYHLRHHYKNEAYWYGITSPLADWVFGKDPRPQQVQLSPLAQANHLKRRG